MARITVVDDFHELETMEAILDGLEGPAVVGSDGDETTTDLMNASP